MGRNEHYKIGKRDLTKPNNWEELDGTTFRITKPTVFCLGGNATLSARAANYFCKLAQNLVGVKAQRYPNEIATTNDVDFIGIGYGLDTETYQEDYIGSLTQQEINELVESIFTPLYLDEKKNVRPREEILKNFNQITFLAHCHGAYEIRNFLFNVSIDMANAGVDFKIINEAIAQIFAVAYAPMSTITCPNLQIIPEKDAIMPFGPAFADVADAFITERMNKIHKRHGTVAYKENPHTITVIATKMTKTQESEHGISAIDRNMQWEPEIERKELAYADEVSKAVAVVLSYAVSNSIQNYRSKTFTPRPTIDFMLQKVEAMLGKTQSRALLHKIKVIKKELGREY